MKYDYFLDMLQILVPNVITLGVVFKVINTELTKKKNEVYLKHLEEVLRVIAMSSQEPNDENSKKVLHKVLELGSETSIKIATAFKKKGLTISDFQELNYEFIAYYPILFCQVKFELTQVKVNPLSWYLLAFSNEFLTPIELAKYKESNNFIVEELKLDKFLKIK
jgi:hypothetical protein